MLDRRDLYASRLLFYCGRGFCFHYRMRAEKGSFPVTEKRPVAEDHFGTTVIDNYRWLDNLDDPAVRKWNEAQNGYTRAYSTNPFP